MSQLKHPQLLKYVRRQLYIETKGITTAINKVSFEHGIKSILKTIQACPPATPRKLRIVTMLGRGPEPVTCRCAAFCEPETLSSLVNLRFRYRPNKVAVDENTQH